MNTLEAVFIIPLLLLLTLGIVLAGIKTAQVSFAQIGYYEENSEKNVKPSDITHAVEVICDVLEEI